MHLAKYPTLPSPTNAQARPALTHVSVPVIAFGSPLNNDFLEQARVEYKLRKFYHSIRLIADDELLRARLRWTALLHEYAANKYPSVPQSTIAQIERLSGHLEDENFGDDLAASVAIETALDALRYSLDGLRRALDGAAEPPLKKEKTEPARKTENSGTRRRRP